MSIVRSGRREIRVGACWCRVAWQAPSRRSIAILWESGPWPRLAICVARIDGRWIAGPF
jgi:hypothetical protein